MTTVGGGEHDSPRIALSKRRAASTTVPLSRSEGDKLRGVHGLLMDQCSVGTTSHQPPAPHLPAGARSTPRARGPSPGCSPAGCSESSLVFRLLESH